MLRFTLLLCALAPTAAAQNLVVPANRVASDGSTGQAFPGFSQRLRMQVVVDDAELVGLRQHEITAIAVRRDGQYQKALQGGRANLIVRVSIAPRPPGSSSPVFATNHGTSVVEVFRGEVVVPDAPALAGRHGATWQSPDAVTIPFTAPFPYAGGHLCIDVEGTPVAGVVSPWWRIDGEAFLHDASVTPVGQDCDPKATGFASRDTLLPGGTVRCVGTGPAGAMGVFLLGVAPLGSGVDLGFLGAPGCVAHVQPLVSVATVYTYPGPDGYGSRNLELQLPDDRVMLGGTLLSQWASYPNPRNAAALTVSRALALRLASRSNTLVGATVRTGPAAASLPDAGQVVPQVMPVLKISYQ